LSGLSRSREHDLVGGCQQLVAADVGEEELEAVGGTDERVLLRAGGDGLLLLRGLLRLTRRLAPIESARLELALQQLDLVLCEVVLEREGLDLGRLDVAAL